MWVYVAVWEVQAGEVRQLAVGDRVERLGVRATFWDLEPTEADEGVWQQRGPTPSGEESPYYRLVGTVEWIVGESVTASLLGSVSGTANLTVTVPPDAPEGSEIPVRARLIDFGGNVAERAITLRVRSGVVLSGAVTIGVLAAAAHADPLFAGARPDGWALMATGVLGSYTTVSSFSLQTLALLRDGSYAHAAGNVLLSLVLCLGGVTAGFVAATALLGGLP